jgi:heme A synthase
MDVAIKIFLILHFIGLAGIIGSWLAVIKDPRVVMGMLHGAILQVVTGLALVGLNEANDADVDHMKIGIKLVIALVILAVAIVGVKKEKQNPGSTAALAHVAGGLGILNVIIAVMW